MELKVIDDKSKEQLPWYGGGLRFTCSQCGNCCTGGPGYVWISAIEIQRMAEHFKLSADEVIKRYCRKVGSRYSLKENRNSRGEYDCVFLKEEKVAGKGDVIFTRRSCTVYPVRPLQCRTWPFWDGNLASPVAWKRASERCHGMNNGARVFGYDEIIALKDAADWPKRPPTSK